MPRSAKKSITIPHPIVDGLRHQRSTGVLDEYPSDNAVLVGLARYQLIVGKPHPITSAIARMHPDDQDCIDDFLEELTRRGLALRGTFLRRVAERVVADDPEPAAGDVETLQAAEILGLARRHQRGDSAVWEEITSTNEPTIR